MHITGFSKKVMANLESSQKSIPADGSKIYKILISLDHEIRIQTLEMGSIH